MSTLYSVIKETTTNNKNKVVVTLPVHNNNQLHGIDISYQQLFNDSKFIANKLQSTVNVGDVVSIVLANGYSILSIFLGVTFNKCIAAPLNSTYTNEEFKYYFKDMNAKLVLIQSDLTAALDAAKELGIKIWEIKENHFADTGKYSVSVDTDTMDGSYEGEISVLPVSSDNALFLHTSGTTSKPKGVPLTHGNLAQSCLNIKETLHLTPADKSLVVMPLFHVHGLIGVCLSSFKGGASLVIPIKFSASVFWNQIREFKVTWYSAVPTIHSILTSVQASSSNVYSNKGLLRFIRSSSSSLSPTLLDSLEDYFGCPVIEAYGMTEASHQMASNPLPKDGPRIPGSVGKGVNVKIAILNESGDILKTGEIGDIGIQGPNVMLGYLNNPQANIDNFIVDTVNKETWFLTGDIGFLDPDNYLTLKGRKKELINRGGEKISPLEVDNALLENDQISEAVCFGVPDQKYGEEVWAAIIPKEAYQKTLTPQQITEFLQKKLVAFKIPKKIILTDNFPKTTTGKIQRRFISEFFYNQHK
ncbi:AMP-dependent synthetase and ligase domain-containing protein [Tieghemostelium lacteum]|uniref:AMP-dependent synthetase and ligase domain-containing protein n=1 Tax=Tieghemostelium lacteum TaxID=361077 RepID=A0A151Z9G3_TIELA|nr:AMP-dependent synthetase and ligase domain-containing protein [Tieghemostelium lacteum]|eukprot:KYQ90588.1 AMP-dependent synthetase and ligase domain-containing protein [Tieghemostelium lacteum]